MYYRLDIISIKEGKYLFIYTVLCMYLCVPSYLHVNIETEEKYRDYIKRTRTPGILLINYIRSEKMVISEK